MNNILYKKKKPFFIKRRSNSETIFFVFCFIFFVLYSLSVIYVLGWTVLSSLKGNREFFKDPFALPERLLFSNYVDAFYEVNVHKTSLFGMLINSIWFSFGSVLIGNMTSLLCGYVFSKYKFRGKNIMFAVNLFTMVVPIYSSGAAGFKLIYQLGINDSPLYLIKYISFLGMSFLVYSTIFNGVSNAYIEAAAIDGAGHLKIFFSVVIQQVWPAFLALVINGVIGAWNDWSTSLYYMENMPTLAGGIYFLQQEMTTATNEPLYLASIVLCCFPVVLLFALSQNKIMNSVYTGGLKG